MTPGLISIILPVFNGSDFLKDCLESIIGQTETNWELIAVDDQSTDSTLALLQSFAIQDARIKVLCNPDKGLIPALRLALSEAQGEWITRMDHDDLMPPHKLFTLSRLLQKLGPGFVVTGMVRYFAEGELGLGYRKYEQWLNQIALKNTHYLEIYKECTLPSPCWMIYRRNLMACGGFDAAKYPEDYDLCFRFRHAGFKIVAAPEVLHWWRDHPNRSTRKLNWYADQTFMELKLEYFLLDDFDAQRPLVLWGAGKKGKKMAQLLIKRKMAFEWICDNPRKWGHEMLDVPWQSPQRIEELKDPQLLILVADPQGQIQIKDFLSRVGPELSAYYFC